MRPQTIAIVDGADFEGVGDAAFDRTWGWKRSSRAVGCRRAARKWELRGGVKRKLVAEMRSRRPSSRREFKTLW